MSASGKRSEIEMLRILAKNTSGTEESKSLEEEKAEIEISGNIYNSDSINKIIRQLALLSPESPLDVEKTKALLLELIRHFNHQFNLAEDYRNLIVAMKKENAKVVKLFLEIGINPFEINSPLKNLVSSLDPTSDPLSDIFKELNQRNNPNAKELVDVLKPYFMAMDNNSVMERRIKNMRNVLTLLAEHNYELARGGVLIQDKKLFSKSASNLVSTIINGLDNSAEPNTLSDDEYQTLRREINAAIGSKTTPTTGWVLSWGDRSKSTADLYSDILRQINRTDEELMRDSVAKLGMKLPTEVSEHVVATRLQVRV